MKLIRRIADQLAQLSESQQAFAEFIVRQTFVAATLPIDEAARRAGVSLATANRCARSLGFDGYAAMRVALLQEFKPRDNDVARTDEYTNDVSLLADLTNLQTTANEFDAASIRRASKLLLNARGVYCVGHGTSETITCFAAHACAPFLAAPFIDLGGMPVESALRHLLQLSRRDVVIVASLPRYSKATVAVAEYAQRAGARVIAITDDAISPLSRLAELVLYAKSEHTHMSASPVSAIAIVNALATSLMQSSPQSVKTALKQSELITHYVQTELVLPSEG